MAATTWQQANCPKKARTDGQNKTGRMRFRRVQCQSPSSMINEFFGPHRVQGRELSEFFSAYYFCAKANSPSRLFAELTELAAELSEFSLPQQRSQNSILPVSQKNENLQKLGARLRGRTATQHSKKGSGKGSGEGFSEGF